MEKLKVSQDVLYQYLLEHNVNISGLAREMDANVNFVGSCFKRTPDRHGKPRRFTPAVLPRLNAALPAFADKMRQSLLVFGSEQTYTNRLGTTYDPAVMSAVRNLSEFFNLTTLTWRVLGWNKDKKRAVMSTPSSGSYCHITQDDVNRLNAELLAVAGVLESYEVVIDDKD